MFNTSIRLNQLHDPDHDGFDEFEAEIERQLAALGPITEDELNDDGDDYEIEKDKIPFLQDSVYADVDGIPPPFFSYFFLQLSRFTIKLMAIFLGSIQNKRQPN